ncbi:alpha/beta fold hydrolase [Desertihabitans aurantiacus]|uniref:alpha/beta fold hydrolase n=1 Tax=Desertihabitans aurantiacus TaxID=2282477 RepID=UPI000DF85BA0|nr:alpha/beta fold hydrolase [Desertihabitans aurantiacus]
MEHEAKVGDLTLVYETFGAAEHPPLLLVFGLGGQMVGWPDGFCQRLADRGFFVIRFDHRDIGGSEVVPGDPVRPLRTLLGLDELTYTLEDLADDAVELLRVLGHDSAHVVGVSMGGMIAQLVAIRHPERTCSLTSIMSTTGRRTVGFPTRLDLVRGAGQTASDDVEEYLTHSVARLRVLAAKGFPFDEEEIRGMLTRSFERGLRPQAAVRQLMAILRAPDRTSALRDLDVPTLVVHGTADPLVHVSGGRATARAVPGAEYLPIEGMGHSLPAGTWDAVVDAIARTAARSVRPPARDAARQPADS